MKKNKNPLISNYDRECLEEVKKSIELTPEQEHSIEMLSLKAGIGRTKLIYGFKNLYGQSIHQYIIYARMEKAKVMLRDSDKPIKAISKLSGYRDVKNFLTAFKKYTGQTPAQYQKR